MKTKLFDSALLITLFILGFLLESVHSIVANILLFVVILTLAWQAFIAIFKPINYG